MTRTKIVKAPKAQNVLTQIVGARKRFGSKDYRDKNELKNSQHKRKSIQIMPFLGIKKKITMTSRRSSSKHGSD